MPKTPTTSANPRQAGAVMDPPQKLLLKDRTSLSRVTPGQSH